MATNSYPGINLYDSSDNIIYPITQASCVTYYDVTLEDVADGLLNQMGELETRVTNLENQYTSIVGDINDLKTANGEYTNKLKGASDWIKELNTIYTTLNNNVSEYLKQVIANTATLNALKDQISTNQVEVRYYIGTLGIPPIIRENPNPEGWVTSIEEISKDFSQAQNVFAVTALRNENGYLTDTEGNIWSEPKLVLTISSGTLELQ